MKDDRQLRMEKKRRTLSDWGVKLCYFGEELRPLQEHLLNLRSRGMTNVQIAALAGVSRGVVNTAVSGKRVRMYADIHDALFGVKYREPEGKRKLREVRAHLRPLIKAGMSVEQIARQADTCHSGLCQILRGTRNASRQYQQVKSINDATHEALMAVRYESPNNRGGQLLPAIGTMRRIQALMADGFPNAILAEFIGWNTLTPINQIALGGRILVMYSTFHKVDQVYGKLAGANPLDYGVSQYGMDRIKSAARRRDWAPSICWEPDTIDNPDTFPEWTGACGTPGGFYIHKRDNILPLCLPCREARAEQTRLRKEGKGVGRGRKRSAHDSG